MRLDELDNVPAHELVSFALGKGRWLRVQVVLDGAGSKHYYIRTCTFNRAARRWEVDGDWNGVDPITAQAVLYAITHGATDAVR